MNDILNIVSHELEENLKVSIIRELLNTKSGKWVKYCMKVLVMESGIMNAVFNYVHTWSMNYFASFQFCKSTFATQIWGCN